MAVCLTVWLVDNSETLYGRVRLFMWCLCVLLRPLLKLVGQHRYRPKPMHTCTDIDNKHIAYM